MIPADCTKTALAEAIALRARMLARKNGTMVTRLLVEEVKTEWARSTQYRSVPFPALRTILAQVRKQAAVLGEPVDLAVTLPPSEPQFGAPVREQLEHLLRLS